MSRSAIYLPDLTNHRTDWIKGELRKLPGAGRAMLVSTDKAGTSHGLLHCFGKLDNGDSAMVLSRSRKRLSREIFGGVTDSLPRSGTEAGTARPTHPNKDIEAAVAFAEARGWQYVHSNGHPWGRLQFHYGQQGGCQFSVWSTPKNAFDHARQIIRRVNRCPH